MTRPHDNDPVHDREPVYDDSVYDMEPDRAPAVRDEPMPDHLDENRDIYAEERPVRRGPVTETEPDTETRVKGSVAGGTWAALIIGALLLIGLLVFILQNQQQVELNVLSWTFEFPAGIGYLFSAITGALIMALVGGVRMLELRRQVKRQRRMRR